VNEKGTKEHHEAGLTMI